MLLNVTAVTSPLNPRPWLAVSSARLKRLKDVLLVCFKLTKVENWRAFSVALSQLERNLIKLSVTNGFSYEINTHLVSRARWNMNYCQLL